MLEERISESIEEGISLDLTWRIVEGIEAEGMTVSFSTILVASVFPRVNVARVLSK